VGSFLLLVKLLPVIGWRPVDVRRRSLAEGRGAFVRRPLVEDAARHLRRSETVEHVGTLHGFEVLIMTVSTRRLGETMSTEADNDNKEHAAGMPNAVNRSTTPTGESEGLGPLRARTKESLIQCRADLSRLEQALTDLKNQVAQARVALGQSYELLGRANELSSKLVKTGSGR